MMALAGPFFGNVHDSRMMRESGWMALLRSIADLDRRLYMLFCDAADSRILYRPCLKMVLERLQVVELSMH